MSISSDRIDDGRSDRGAYIASVARGRSSAISIRVLLKMPSGPPPITERPLLCDLMLTHTAKTLD